MAETPLQQTERHVVEGRIRLDAQGALIERVKHLQHPGLLAAAIAHLGLMQDFQSMAERHLAELMARNSK